MKNVKYIVLIFLGLTSCHNEVKREVLYTYEDSIPKIVAEYTKEQFQNNIYKRIQYHPNGEISGQGPMKNGKRNGTWRYYDQYGNKIAENTLRNDVKIDSTICWYPEGQISRRIIELKSPNNLWESIDYYKNGQIKTISFLINGEIPDSLFIEYFKNGNLKRSGKLIEGRKIGEWISYDSTGQKITNTFETGENYITFTNE